MEHYIPFIQDSCSVSCYMNKKNGYCMEFSNLSPYNCSADLLKTELWTASNIDVFENDMLKVFQSMKTNPSLLKISAVSHLQNV